MKTFKKDDWVEIIKDFSCDGIQFKTHQMFQILAVINNNTVTLDATGTGFGWEEGERKAWTVPSQHLSKLPIKSTSSPNTSMEARTVYTHPDAKGVELWATPEGLSVRNGKRGKPVVLSVPIIDDGIEELIAETFFAGLTYNA